MINPYRILYCARCDWQYPGNAHAIGLKPECPDCGGHGLNFMSGDANDPEDWKQLSSKIERRRQCQKDMKRSEIL